MTQISWLDADLIRKTREMLGKKDEKDTKTRTQLSWLDAESIRKTRRMAGKRIGETEDEGQQGHRQGHNSIG